MTRPQVFISYSHSDAGWAEEFARSLEKQGLSVWLDRFELTPGRPWAEALETALRDSDVFAFLVQPDKLNSPFLSFELGAAISMRKTVVPVVPPSVQQHQLPSPLRRIQWLERTSPEETAQKFAQALESLFEKAA